MKVTQEKLPASQVGLEIEITPDMSKKAYDKALQEFTRSANIPGFRKGKVPRQVLIQRFGPTRIKAAVVEELVEDSLKKAIEQEKIDAIGNFELRSSFEELVNRFEPGAAFTFSAAVDVPPEVQLNQYKDLHVKAEEITYEPSRVDDVLENYRKQAATLVPVEGRAAQMGDVAVVDFVGRLTAEDSPEGEEPAEIPGGSAQDFEIELAEGKFIAGFIDGIIGMKPDETKDVTVTFPENYPQEDLSNKAAVFTITLKELKEKELPELDDDFAQEISEFETLAELRESLESRFKKDSEERTKANKEQALLNELVQHLEVEIPETLIKREVDYSITQTAMRLSEQGMDIRKTFTQDIVSALRQQARPEAIARIHRTLALGEVAKKESITVEPEAVDAKVKEMLEGYSEQEIDMDRLKQVVEEDVLKEKILTWLEEHNTVELVPEGSLKESEAPEAEAELDATEANVTEDTAPSAELASDATVEVAAEVVNEETEAAESEVEETEAAESDVQASAPAASSSSEAKEKGEKKS